MGNSQIGNGFSSPSLDTSPTYLWDEPNSLSKPTKLHGTRRGYLHGVGTRRNPFGANGKKLEASWVTPATPLDIPTPYSNTEWRHDFEERYQIQESSSSSFGACPMEITAPGRRVGLVREKQTDELLLVEQIERRRQRCSLWEVENFDNLDVELAVRQDLSSSSGVATVRECHLQPHTYTIISERCAGPTLRQKLQDSGPLSEKEVATVVCSVIEILKLCRERFILHGGVTSEAFHLQNNTINTAKMAQRGSVPVGWLKATNFINSRYILDGGNLGHSADKANIPSGYCYSAKHSLPLYMAPEVLDQRYGYNADMWSLGVMIYELLSGKLPFWKSTQGALQSSPESVRAIIRTRKVDLTSPRVENLSTTCLDFIYQMLEKDPLRRLSIHKALDHPWITRRVRKVQSHEFGDAYYLNKSIC